jgi:hypothetical protein
MKNDNCMILNKELEFFQNLNLDIQMRRAVFKKFEDEMKKTNLTIHNDFMAISWYGYVVSQLSDCRKFFDRDGNTRSFQFVVKHIKDSAIQSKHGILFERWKKDKLETVINKYLLHADKRVSEVATEVSVKTLNAFIDELENYLKEIVDDLNKNYSGIGSLNYEGYLKEREREVEIFFEEVRK